MKRVLIVDDAIDVARLLQAALSTLDQEMGVVTVPSAEEALLETSRQMVDLLVTDIRLPGMSGIDLARKIKARYPNMKFMLMTGMVDFPLKEQAEATGAAAFFRKPLRVPDFLDAVRHALDLGQAPAAESSAVTTVRRTVSPPTQPSGRVSTAPLNRMPEVISSLHHSLLAAAVILLDDRGRVIGKSGELPGGNFEKEWAPAIMAVNNPLDKMGRLVAPSDPLSAALVFRGKDYNIITAPVVELTLVVFMKAEGCSALRLSLALEEVLGAQKSLYKILGEMGVRIQPAVAAAPTPETPSAPTPDTQAVVSALPVSPEEETDMSDFAELFNQPGSQDATAFWDSVTEQTGNAETINPDVLSYDQAKKLGLTPDKQV
jgi:CheY-like chemotaxis protein